MGIPTPKPEEKSTVPTPKSQPAAAGAVATTTTTTESSWPETWEEMLDDLAAQGVRLPPGDEQQQLPMSAQDQRRRELLAELERSCREGAPLKKLEEAQKWP